MRIRAHFVGLPAGAMLGDLLKALKIPVPPGAALFCAFNCARILYDKIPPGAWRSPAGEDAWLRPASAWAC